MIGKILKWMYTGYLGYAVITNGAYATTNRSTDIERGWDPLPLADESWGQLYSLRTYEDLSGRIDDDGSHLITAQLLKLEEDLSTFLGHEREFEEWFKTEENVNKKYAKYDYFVTDGDGMPPVVCDFIIDAGEQEKPEAGDWIDDSKELKLFDSDGRSNEFKLVISPSFSMRAMVTAIRKPEYQHEVWKAGIVQNTILHQENHYYCNDKTEECVVYNANILADRENEPWLDIDNEEKGKEGYFYTAQPLESVGPSEAIELVDTPSSDFVWELSDKKLYSLYKKVSFAVYLMTSTADNKERDMIYEDQWETECEMIFGFSDDSIKVKRTKNTITTSFKENNRALIETKRVIDPSKETCLELGENFHWDEQPISKDRIAQANDLFEWNINAMEVTREEEMPHQPVVNKRQLSPDLFTETSAAKKQQLKLEETAETHGEPPVWSKAVLFSRNLKQLAAGDDLHKIHVEMEKGRQKYTVRR